MKHILLLLIIYLSITAIFSTTISDIQFTVDPSGDSPLEGQIVTITGIVTATGYYNDGENYFFISENDGGAWSGIYIYHPDTGVQIGDNVEVTGTVSEYYGFTEIISASISVISSGNPLPLPTEISTNDLSNEEMYESVLVTINNISVTELPNQYGEWYVDDGSGECQIDNGIFTYSSPYFGECFSSITGIVDYSFSNYGLHPRSSNDIKHLSFDDMTFGSDSTFDIVTWNLEHFPKHNEETINLVIDIILALDVDFIALQEIEDVVSFDELRNALTGWDGFRSNSAAYDVNLAYLYKTNDINIISTYTLFSGNYYIYPRYPLVSVINWQNTNITIINNHLKAMSDPESENRRREACIGLKEFIDQNYDDLNVILLGDLNDSLTDTGNSNVFQCFLDDEENYQFADMSIAMGSSSNWSLPPSAHFDHILITNELFEIFDDDDSQVSTIKVDMFLDGGWAEYDEYLSNHRPVALKLDMNNNVDLDKKILASQNDFLLSNYPNPFNPITNILFSINKNANVELSIYNVKNQKIKTLTNDHFLKGEHSIVWQGDDDLDNIVSSGIYFYKLTIDNKLKSIKKCLLLK